jgi:hypothetical protein
MPQPAFVGFVRAWRSDGANEQSHRIPCCRSIRKACLAVSFFAAVDLKALDDGKGIRGVQATRVVLCPAPSGL